MSPGDVKRPYHSPTRVEQALRTRRRIRATAEGLFLRAGYGATSMKQVAADAGVAERTLYLNFPTKASLLNEIIRVRARGHDRDEPLAVGQGFQAVLTAPRGQLLPQFARMVTALLARTARVLAIGEAAAIIDSTLQEFRDAGHRATRADLRTIAEALDRRGELAPNTTIAEATDTLFAVAGNEALYLRLIDECGWTDERYAQLLTALLAHLVAG